MTSTVIFSSNNLNWYLFSESISSKAKNFPSEDHQIRTVNMNEKLVNLSGEDNRNEKSGCNKNVPKAFKVLNFWCFQFANESIDKQFIKKFKKYTHLQNEFFKHIATWDFIHSTSLSAFHPFPSPPPFPREILYIKPDFDNKAKRTSLFS